MTAPKPYGWRVLTDEEVAESHEQWRRDAIADAWNTWAEWSCVERHGQHLWHLYVEEGSAHVACGYCNADPYPDHTDMLTLDPIPVNVAIESWRDYWSGEYDVTFDVWPKGADR